MLNNLSNQKKNSSKQLNGKDENSSSINSVRKIVEEAA